MFGPKIKLDKDLLERCKQHAKQLGYSSVDEFIVHTLEKELRSIKNNSSDDTEDVAKQLKGLGYLG